MPEPPPPPRFRRLVVVAVLLVGAAAAFGLVVRSAPARDYREWLAYGGLGGLAAGLLYWHRFRGLGFIPPALTVAAAAGAWAALDGWSGWLVAVTSVALALPFVRAFLYLARFHPGPLLPLLVAAALGFVVAGGGEGVISMGTFGPDRVPVWWPAGLAAGLAVVAWVRLFRPVFELAFEVVLWVMYPVRPAGPGLRDFPATGPCLIVANHACWFDPLFLAKVVPRPVTAMMTSRFYDLPVLRWLMTRVLHPIRVFESARKPAVPDEVREAIAALDGGECVLIFPEGYLRRTEDRPVRRFGRGVWQILAARPDTPVYPCWIEGGWGSYMSYYNGKPTQNKKLDFRRRIGVAVDGPVALDAVALGHHLTGRIELMNRVAAARKLLGLPEMPLFDLPSPGDSKDGDPDDSSPAPGEPGEDRK